MIAYWHEPTPRSMGRAPGPLSPPAITQSIPLRSSSSAPRNGSQERKRTVSWHCAKVIDLGKQTADSQQTPPSRRWDGHGSRVSKFCESLWNALGQNLKSVIAESFASLQRYASRQTPEEPPGWNRSLMELTKIVRGLLPPQRLILDGRVVAGGQIRSRRDDPAPHESARRRSSRSSGRSQD